jgi:hypothetical protein
MLALLVMAGMLSGCAIGHTHLKTANGETDLYGVFAPGIAVAAPAPVYSYPLYQPYYGYGPPVGFMFRFGGGRGHHR